MAILQRLRSTAVRVGGTKVTMLMPILDAGAETWGTDRRRGRSGHRSLGRRCRTSDDAVVVVLVERNHTRRAEVILRCLPASLSHRFKTRLITQQRDSSCRHGLDIAYVEEKAVVAILNQLGDAADAGSDRRHTARHRFERRPGRKTPSRWASASGQRAEEARSRCPAYQ